METSRQGLFYGRRLIVLGALSSAKEVRLVALSGVAEEFIVSRSLGIEPCALFEW